MIKKLSIILILILSLGHCEYKPIYSSNIENNFVINLLDVSGDDEMNNFVVSNLKKYSNLSSERVFDLKVNTKYSKEGLIKNKKGEIKTFLLKSNIIFQVAGDDINEKYSFSDQIKINNNNDEFGIREYEKSIKNNFINSKINELILELSSYK